MTWLEFLEKQPIMEYGAAELAERKKMRVKRNKMSPGRSGVTSTQAAQLQAAVTAHQNDLSSEQS